jgi:hypothetical protein
MLRLEDSDDAPVGFVAQGEAPTLRELLGEGVRLDPRGIHVQLLSP